MTGNDITKTTDEQVQALTKAGYDLYCAAENLAGQAIAAWPYPDLAEELREQLAGSLEELARQMRGDFDEDEGDAEAQIAAYMADLKFNGRPRRPAGERRVRRCDHERAPTRARRAGHAPGGRACGVRCPQCGGVACPASDLLAGVAS